MKSFVILYFIALVMTAKCNNKSGSNNYFSCGQNMVNIIPDFQQLINDLTQTTTIVTAAVLMDLQQIISNIDPVAQACSVNLPQPDSPGNFQNCLGNANTVAAHAEIIISNLGNIPNDINNLQVIVNALAQADADCFTPQYDPELI